MKSLWLLTLTFISFSSLACPKILQKYPDECRIHNKYQVAKRNAWNRYGINLEFLTGYRAKRLIEKDVWEEEQDRIRCRPERAYLPSPDVWVKWEKGSAYISEVLVDEKLKGLGATDTINTDFIRMINAQSVSEHIMGLMATELKDARPGKIRDKSYQLPGFTFNCVSGKVSDEHVEATRDFDILDDNGKPLVWIKAHACPNGPFKQGVLSYTATSNVKPEMDKLMKFIHENLAKYNAGTNDPNYSPLDFISEVQRWFVAIHPFGDGNGRTSRFLQDYLMAKFGLPYAPSGNLQNDVLMKKEDYQALYREETLKQVEELEGCVEEFKEIGLENKEKLSCNCRPMYEDEKHIDVVNYSIHPDIGPCNTDQPQMSPSLTSEIEEFFFNIVYALEK